MGRQFIVPRPPAEVYKNPKRSGLAAMGSVRTRVIQSIETPEEGGFLVWFKGLKYPRKGVMTPESVMVMVCVKRSFFSLARFLVSSPMRYFLVVFLVTPKIVQVKVFRAFFEYFIKRYAFHIFEPHLLNPRYLCRSMREIYRVGKTLSERYAGWREEILISAELFCAIMDSDNAWRYRFQNIVGLLDKTLFYQNPSKEIMRVLEIARNRERTYKNEIPERKEYERYDSFLKIISFVFRMKPSLKRIALEIVSVTDLDEVKLDEADVYFCLTRPDYDIFDKNFSERTALRRLLDATQNEDERDTIMRKIMNDDERDSVIKEVLKRVPA